MKTVLPSRSRFRWGATIVPEQVGGERFLKTGDSQHAHVRRCGAYPGMASRRYDCPRASGDEQLGKQGQSVFVYIETDSIADETKHAPGNISMNS